MWEGCSVVMPVKASLTPPPLPISLHALGAKGLGLLQATEDFLA